MTRYNQLRVARIVTRFMGCLKRQARLYRLLPATLVCVLCLFFDAQPFPLSVDTAFAKRVTLSEARKAIDRLYEQAVRGEDYDAAVEGIIAYVENGKFGVDDQRHAIRRLQDLAAPELKDYLLGIVTKEIEFENSDQLSAYAHRAYWATLLATAPNTAEQERILVDALEAVVTRRVEGQGTQTRSLRSMVVRRWAANELCRRGKSEHIDKIARIITPSKTNNSARQRLELCRRQMELLNKFDDRLATMEHILLSLGPLETKTTSTPEATVSIQFVVPTVETRLMKWALDELVEMEPDNMDEILIDYLVRLHAELANPSVFRPYVRTYELLQERNWTHRQIESYGIEPLLIAD